MIPLLVFTAIYSALASKIVFYQQQRLTPVKLKQAKAVIRTIEILNVINAIVTSLLSSWVLLFAGIEEITNINGRLQGYNQLASWTIEAVCGYIVVELALCFISRCRLSRQSWDLLIDYCNEMVIFHVVALFGLASVLVLDSGYTVAMWVIWSEIASVFTGIEHEFHYASIIPRKYKEWFSLLFNIVCTVSIVLQRAVVFLWLLGLCVVQFTWKSSFVCQLSILCVGTALNIYIASDQVRETFRLIKSSQKNV